MTLSDKRILYISYNGMLEPLGLSQVIPYLRELSKLGLQFTLLSFERANAFTSSGAAQRVALKQELAAHNIEWHWLRYHQSPSLPATAFDVLHGIRVAKEIVTRKRIELVHARSHIPAMIALRLKRQLGVKIIFDLRGLMADEYVDAGHWSKQGLRYRLTKFMESRIFAGADAVVTLTEKIWPVIRGWDGLRSRNPVHEVVPCCADLDRFRFSEQARRARRAELRVSEEQRVLVYSGSIGGWYLTENMAELFAYMARQDSRWHFLWLTSGPAELIRKAMSERSLSSDQYTVAQASPSQVSSYLSAADAAIAFYKPELSRLATSPVKVAEYLACGLPIVLNAGIGDSDALVTDEGLGVLIHDFVEAEYTGVTIAIEPFLADQAQTRRRSRAVAERIFDVRTVGVQRYARLYEQLLAGN